MNRLKGLISLCVFLVDRGRNHIEICPFWSFLDILKISPVQTTILTQSTVLICFFSSSAMSEFFLGGYPRYIKFSLLLFLLSLIKFGWIRWKHPNVTELSSSPPFLLQCFGDQGPMCLKIPA